MLRMTGADTRPNGRQVLVPVPSTRRAREFPIGPTATALAPHNPRAPLCGVALAPLYAASLVRRRDPLDDPAWASTGGAA
jgi:hypothetical protein